MSMFDWVAGGLIKLGVETPGFAGSDATTCGDAVAGFYGSRHAHIFGPDVKLVCDIEDMIVTHGIEGGLKMPIAAALLAGIGGNVTFVYGSNTTATYVGPKMEIRRAENVTKTSDNIVAKVAGEDVVDTATVAVVTVLSVLICATTMAFELAIHFAYPKFGSTSAADKESIEHYGSLPETLKLCVIMITTRLMAFLKYFEDLGSWANLAEIHAKDAVFSVMAIIALPLCFVCPMVGIPMLLAGAVASARVALTSTENAASAH
jgi:hypothetical protein